MIRVSLVAAREAAQHRPDGYIDDLVSSGEIDGDYVVMTTASYDRLVLKYARCLRPCGVGCQSKKILESFGLRESPGCLCGARSAVMDSWGPDECAKPERTAEILGWFREESERRGLPYIEVAAKAMLGIAIRRARKNEAAIRERQRNTAGDAAPAVC